MSKDGLTTSTFGRFARMGGLVGRVVEFLVGFYQAGMVKLGIGHDIAVTQHGQGDLACITEYRVEQAHARGQRASDAKSPDRS